MGHFFDDDSDGMLMQAADVGVQPMKIPSKVEEMPQVEQEQLEILYAAEARLRRSAEVRAQRLELVHRVGERLKADLDEAEIGQRVAAAVREALGFRMVAVNLVDEPGNPASPWRVVATVGIPPEGVAMSVRERL